MLEWAVAGMKADLDEYDRQPPYMCSKNECENIWKSAIKKLKDIAELDK